MAIDIARITDVLKNALLRELGDEVELIFCYGSYLKGTAHKYSDLDISYVPARESTWKSITVLVDDTMIDLYPIHWSRLERMAQFDDQSCTVLLENQLVYQRSEEVAQRFRALPEKLRALQEPDALPAMLEKAQQIFQKTGYSHYLLCEQAAKNHQLSCLHHARQILQAVLHSLTVCNQACIDTRKMDQVLALPRLPVGFADAVTSITTSCDVEVLLSASETLLRATRDLLLSEQRRVQRSEATFAAVFDSAYPELKGDLQHLVLACERRDMFNFNLMSIYHELMIHIARAFTGVEYSSFNSLAEYEQDLVALGFPDLLSYVLAEDFAGLQQQCEAFDQHLKTFLCERSVALNSFATLDELEVFLQESSADKGRQA
jgi:hypothetical protein